MSITDKLIREIEEQVATNHEGKTAVTPVAKNAAKVPVAAKLKKITVEKKTLFKSMCQNHEKIRAGIKTIDLQMTQLRERVNEKKKELGAVKERIANFCIKKGVVVRQQDMAFYARPWKAQVEIKRNSDSMSEPVREWAQQKIGMMEVLFPADPESHAKLDITGLRKMLDQDRALPPALRTQLMSHLEAIVKLADAQGLVEHAETILDLEAYDKAKTEGLIPQSVVKAAENETSYINAVSVNKIEDFTTDRCEGCSDKLPKKREPKHACKRCGTLAE